MRHGVRRKWVAVVALAAVVVIGGGIAFASKDDGTVNKQVRRFRILGYDSYDLDVGETGRSPGDTFFVKHELWNYGQTAKVGEYDTACVIEKDVGAGADLRSLNRCTATAILRDGTIELATRVWRTEAEKTLPYAVIGGSRAYKNVAGQATVVFEGDILKLELIPSFKHP